MPIDIQSEKMLLLHSAPGQYGLPKVSRQALYRWWQKGIRGVRLETCMIGGYRYTSAESIRRFVEAQNATENVQPSVSRVQRSRQNEAAMESLKRDFAFSGASQ